MIFRPQVIQGAFVIDAEAHEDERGTFARAFCVAEFRAHGLDPRVAQTSMSSNRRRGTRRGMHYAAPPSTESKLVRCVRGRVFDVLVDLRGQDGGSRPWFSLELSRDNARALFVPPGVAHGFLTLEDETDVLYQMTEPYDAQATRGVRYDDPAFGIVWPFAPTTISERDRTYPDFARRSVARSA
jgi:dTDP-4-dehydrorhamnose 3,5-epimerase